MATQFWQQLDQLVASGALVIDRPKGTAHPRYPGFVYPYDYGYLGGTHSMDGGGIDVWVGSLPERRLTAIAVTLDLEKRDSEIKLLIGCAEAEIQAILAVHNNGPQSAILVRRPER